MLNDTARDVLVTLAVSGVTTLNMYLSGALTIALPTIGKDLKFSEATLQWPVSVYSLSYGCLLLFFGRVGDIIGPRRMFLFGSGWFAAWSIATAFAPTDEIFILFIALTGVGAAANTPAALGLVVQHFPPGTGRSRCLGILGAFQPIGWILGLVLGGLLSGSKASWRSIFFIESGLAVFFGITGFLVFKADHADFRYTKGLDWGGAFLSTAGIGLLTYSLADSTATAKGWATPRIPTILALSIIVIGLFLYYERYRERRELSVIMPLSMWSRPKAKMPAMMLMVFFAWWSFNGLLYWCNLYFQQVLLLSPIEASVRFIPVVVSGIIVNVLSGWFMNRLPGQPLILIGLLGNVVAPLIFALIDVNSSFWSMAFIMMCLTAGADVAYPIGTLHLSLSFEEHSQSLAGGIFNVATRLGTALGVAITSSIATSVSRKYHRAHPSLEYDSPEVLMVGFRAAGWACFAAGIIAVVTVIFGLRGMGVVGAEKASEDELSSTHSVGRSADDLEKKDVDVVGLSDTPTV